MTQKTSWDGILTKQLRRNGKRNFYTRYANRREKQGLEVVVPKENALYVYTPAGAIKRIEPKYHNYNGNEKSAGDIYEKQVKKQLMKSVPKHLRKFVNLR